MFPWTENRLLRKALSLYAGEHVLEHVLRNGNAALSPSGKRIELTLLFVDVAGFTQGEALASPADLAALMSRYCEFTTKAIIGGGGVVDMYVGDSISAWWGADGNPGHPEQACVSARGVLLKVEKLNEELHQAGWPLLKIKMGIHTGVVTLGSYGSSQRLRYSVLGDAVNTAARLCGLANTQYPTPIVISENTSSRLSGAFSPRLLETVRVKGRENPMGLYAL